VKANEDENLRNLSAKYEEMLKHLRFVDSTLGLLRDLARRGDVEELEAARPLKLDATLRLERIGDLSDQMVDILSKVKVD
jgi:hypothetical protein